MGGKHTSFCHAACSLFVTSDAYFSSSHMLSTVRQKTGRESHQKPDANYCRWICRLCTTFRPSAVPRTPIPPAPHPRPPVALARPARRPAPPSFINPFSYDSVYCSSSCCYPWRLKGLLFVGWVTIGGLGGLLFVGWVTIGGLGGLLFVGWVTLGGLGWVTLCGLGYPWRLGWVTR